MSLLRRVNIADTLGNVLNSVLGALKISVHDGAGNPIGSQGGALNIHDADVHTIPVNELFHEHTGTTTTLAVASVKGATSLTVVSSAGFVVGDTIQIENGVIETTFPTITVIAANVLTLDRPLDFAFDIGDNVEVVTTNMNVVGTLGAPISYRVIPSAGEVWHVQSFIIAMTHSGDGDDSKFGDITGGLTNGVVLRGYNATADQYLTLTNWKTNKDIRLDAFTLDYSSKAGPGVNGTSADGAFKQRTGAIARIDGDAGDYIEVLIQDDTSSLTSFEIKAQGHIEGG